MVAIGEHYRPAAGADEAAPLTPGVYRVVGTGDPVVLLLVGTAEGRRQHAGTIHHVDTDTVRSSFESAENPDEGFDPAGILRNAAQGLYWEFRRLF